MAYMIFIPILMMGKLSLSMEEFKTLIGSQTLGMINNFIDNR